MAWSGGLAEWQDGDITYLSVAFTWKLDEAYSRALFAKACGQRVIAGGPALFLVKMQHELSEVAEISKDYPDAITHHNPLATFASRGCPVGCWFCIVPAMEGREFTLIPDFLVRPILCDNNLSALEPKYQDHIIERYQAEGVKLKDANGGFDPITSTEEVYRRWKPLVNAGGGPWRFAYDETKEGPQVHQVMKMLAGEPQKRKRVYVLIGNEPFAECMARIEEVIAAGCEPHVQPYMKLNALEKVPHAMPGGPVQPLQAGAGGAKGGVGKRAPFGEYDGPRKPASEPPYAAE